MAPPEREALQCPTPGIGAQTLQHEHRRPRTGTRHVYAMSVPSGARTHVHPSPPGSSIERIAARTCSDSSAAASWSSGRDPSGGVSGVADRDAPAPERQAEGPTGAHGDGDDRKSDRRREQTARWLAGPGPEPRRRQRRDREVARTQEGGDVVRTAADGPQLVQAATR